MTTKDICAAADRAVRAIPPLWPLAASVAVNPFLGQSGEPLERTAARLARVAGSAVTMPRRWYREKIERGEILAADLEAAAAGRLSPTELIEATRKKRPERLAIPTVADLSAHACGTDWPALVAERTSHFAASIFDTGQALWPSPAGQGPYALWRSAATHDLTPEIAGLFGFAAFASALPASSEELIALAVRELALPADALDLYFHRLLTLTGGWAQVARYRLWQAELAGGADSSGTDLLAIMLAFELALYRQHRDAIAGAWTSACRAFAEPPVPSADDRIDAMLQEAAERAAQRRLQALLAEPRSPRPAERPSLQMAFCIDVRSELFRRALESLDPGIRTLGFAGFFGLGTGHRRLGSDVIEARLPVLLTPGVHSHSGGAPEQDQAYRIARRASRAWDRFKLAAVSSFAFVEAAGPTYVLKLVRDALGLKRNDAPHDPAPVLDPALDLATRIATATAVLRAMSLTEGFAPLVILAGHGANTVNNPHGSALHCGACGGYSGEVNARLLAGLLNDPEVRDGLAATGIVIPADTHFCAALHDTTTDAVTLYADDHPSPAHAGQLERARRWLAAAGTLTATERARRLPRASDAADVAARARNWAELRPEWALAGCQAFVAAPRARTAGKDLAGRAFLHDYDWRADAGFGVLELILTAPVVVASWISLQYYGSTVAPGLFGAGNKLLHNVTGGLGVVEGNGGLLRGGLPIQSVSDGEQLMHEPLRLSVLVEAPRAAITDILARHEQVRALFDNKWLHLFALDDQGRMAWRYTGDLGWEEMAPNPADERVAA
ncbi:YbcC family protein [Sphingomonas astaxanthinifaciens]|uniref:Probable inorganic carbon transporter subunit DabA n=1 Tax=Sphingomonas astaxanthinifaciens DSM 22298 TaxID=1123267 RepID=A0ABQ5Z9R8_9SPHN|nr:DUF2309 domain-containing protein [Sphingomonas astaxanthinifaciens]GLR48365.1 UPF0753 protein [Sphingomonas astaxanthinifaciens DSM 22298]